MRINPIFYLIWTALLINCKSNLKPDAIQNVNPGSTNGFDFPKELVEFTSYTSNPVFSGSGQPTWDENIRERGYILFENNQYFLWYTGFRNGSEQSMSLGFAISNDGYSWQRYPGNPIFDSLWTEDMMVVKSDSTYYMFAEGKNDIAHMLTSIDRIHWKDQGNLDIRYSNGSPLSSGPYGTPTVWLEGGIWNLYYERNDEGIWLAKSQDLKLWINVQDDPVLTKGPESYDQFGVAMNQVIKYKGNYYGYYHGTALKDWSEWSTNLASSKDLIHWTKYPNNPILKDNKSSGILVDAGLQFRMYTMHPSVRLHFSEKN